MRRLRPPAVLWAAALILIGALPAAAQAEADILICVTGLGCEWTPAPAGFTPDDLAVLVGEEPPSADAFVVCDVSGTGCAWSEGDPDALDLEAGGNGAVGPLDEGDPGEDFLICIDGLGCQAFAAPADFTRDELDRLLADEPPPTDDAVLVCDDLTGCRWTTVDAEALDAVYGGDGAADGFAPRPSDARLGVYPTTEAGTYIPVTGDWLYSLDFTGFSAACPPGMADLMGTFNVTGMAGLDGPITYAFDADFTMRDLFNPGAGGMTAAYEFPSPNAMIATLSQNGVTITYAAWLINPEAILVDITVAIPGGCTATIALLGLAQRS